MAFTKMEQFDPKIVAMAEFADALSHPVRIAIILYLLENPGSRCSSLVEILPLSQPSCSRHLKVLRDAGLLEAQSSGNEVHYSLKFERIQHFCNTFSSSFQAPDCD